jgi:hypothetical protein
MTQDLKILFPALFALTGHKSKDASEAELYALQQAQRSAGRTAEQRRAHELATLG